MKMDIVYTVRPGESNEELRYSLRSLCKNFPNHGRVFILGYCPSWVTNVVKVTRVQNESLKYKRVGANFMKLYTETDVTEKFVTMNDDFFFMKPIEEIPVYYTGTLQERLLLYERIKFKGPYIAGMRETLEKLQELGIKEPLNYDLHVPMVREVSKCLEVRKISDGMAFPHGRTLYGNLFKIGGEKHRDVKIISRTHSGLSSLYRNDWLFLSTSDNSFMGSVGRFIRREFSEKCKYEL